MATEEKQNVIALVVGKKGSGKSHYVKTLLSNEKPKRVIIFDALWEYDIDGHTLVFSWQEAVELLRENIDGEFRLTVRLEDEAEYEQIVDVLRYVGNLTLVIEEFHLYCNHTYTYPEIKKLIRLGRHWGINIIGITQRIPDIPRDFTHAMDLLVVFRTTEPRDLDYFRKLSFVGDEGAKRISMLSAESHELAEFRNQ